MLLMFLMVHAVTSKTSTSCSSYVRKIIYQQSGFFLATGHGKNSCDGVGGLLKHQATLYNLRAASSAVIMSASQMVAQMSAKLKNVKLLCANADELETFRQFKKSQWKSLPRVPGIRSWHVWLSTSEGTDRGRVLLASRTAKCDLQKMQPF